MLSFTWFDDKTAYRFFRDGGGKEEIPNVPLKTGYVKPYSVNPDISGFEQRKKRIKVLSSVYGNEYAQRLLYFHLTLDCFLRLKMPINRIYLLLNETYFYFERYLYAKVNWDEGKPGYYRDHSLHAANEAYLGHKLLKELELKFIDFFNQNNDINCYINENCKIGRSSERLQQVIYRTWFIAALFHDLGYVLGFKKEVSENMLRFHRYSDLIARDGRSSFDDIRLLLGNSLLFNTVKHKELEHSYNNNNHGTLSAFLVLSTFYTPPAFEGVDSLDRVAIELAAHAIYHHDYIDFPDITQDITQPNAKRNKNETCSPECSGQWSCCFEITTADSEEITKLLNDNQMDNISIYKLNLSEIKADEEIKTPKTNSFLSSPFSSYLYLIDTIHVFGRTCFSIDTKYNGKETPRSFLMPKVRNVVKYPAQIVKCVNNTLKVYFVADASLYNRYKQDKSKNPFYDRGHNRLNESGIKYFLKELYWLNKIIKEANLFEDLEFYFIESWPRE